jgi:SAM-dependent methyltransferase
MLVVAEKYIQAQGLTNVLFGLVDAENLPLEAHSFDLVTCRIAPHHFSDCALFINEGARVLKPGGLLLVQDHVLPQDQDAARYIDDFERLRDPSHNHSFSHQAWLNLFEGAGLNVIHTQEITKRHQLITWAARQGCSTEVIGELNSRLVHAPPGAARWLQVRDSGTQIASFINHHILIAGKTPVNGV